MDEKQLLDAIRGIIKEEVREAVKEEIEPIKTDITNMKSDISELSGSVANLKSDVSELSGSVAVIEVQHGEKLNAVYEAVTAMNKNFPPRIDLLERKSDNHDTRLFALEQVVGK